MPTQMSAQEVFEDLLAYRSRWLGDPSDSKNISFLAASVKTVEDFIIERTAPERDKVTATYLRSLVSTVAYSPFASEVYHYTHLELIFMLKEIDESPAWDSPVGLSRRAETMREFAEADAAVVAEEYPY